MASHLCGLPFSFNPSQHFDTIGGHDGPDIDSNVALVQVGPSWDVAIYPSNVTE